MAVDWDDFSEVGIADRAPLDTLREAYEERAAAADAHGKFLGNDAAFATGCSGPPRLECLSDLRNAIRALAPSFVDMDSPRHEPTSWKLFPLAFTANDLMRGEHSLAVLPEPGAPDFNATSLATYRTFLANCAWWLKRFRHVDVSPLAYYTRESAAGGYHHVTESETWGRQEDGEPPEYWLGRPEHTDYEGRHVLPAANALTIKSVHHGAHAIEDSFSRKEGWRYGVWRYEWEQISETVLSGLVVRNFSVLPGRLSLVPCFSASRQIPYPERVVETKILHSLIPDFNDGDPLGYYAGRLERRETRHERHGSRWLETYDSHFTGEQSWSGDTIQRTGRRVVEQTNWSEDGSRSFTETESEEETGWSDYTIQERFDVTLTEFDGFGAWTLGVPVEKGLVPGHDRVEALPKWEGALPKADDWSTAAHDLFERHTQRSQWSDVSLTHLLRLVPVLDFNESYRYKETN